MSMRLHGVFRGIAAIVACILLLLFCVGCGMRLREDAIKEDLPQIYPNAGLGQELETVLYFRLADEPYLIPVKRTIQVRANEDPAEVVIRELIAGPDAIFGDLQAGFPADAGLVDFQRESNNTVFVTLNTSLLQTDAYAGTTRAEQELSQRMGVYAIVNSLCALQNTNTVQIMVDVSGSGQGRRVAPFQLGFSKEEMPGEFLGPMSKKSSVILNMMDDTIDAAEQRAALVKLVELALSHLVDGEFQKADRLFADMETGGLQKPAYAAFEREMLALGTIDWYRVLSTRVVNGQINAEAEVEFRWTSRADGIPRTVQTTLQLIPEGVIYKLGYYSLMDAIQASLLE